MRDQPAPGAGPGNGSDWLASGAVRLLRLGRGDRNSLIDSQCLNSAVAAIDRAPAGRVAVAASSLESPFLALDLTGRDVETLEPPELLEAPDSAAGQGPPLCALILDGLLERTGQPAALLAGARQRLLPGGVLLLTASRCRRNRLPQPRALATDDRIFTHPGQTLPTLLFQAGFERPRFLNYGDTRLIVARRSELPPPGQRAMRLSVIMPVYNERETFEKAIDLVLAKEIPGVDIEVIVVESNSTDGTREEVLGCRGTPRVSVILEDSPRGKGHAVRRGLEAAQGDFILIQDADLEYDVDDYVALLEPLRQGQTGFVLGTRTKPDGSWGMRHFGQDTTMSHFMNVGHIGFLALFNLVYQQKLRDPFTMYKVFRRDCLNGIELECDRFDFDWELTAKLIRAGYHPVEVPVSYHSRSFAEGKKISLLRDPLTWIRACFLYRFSPLYRDGR